MGVVVVAVLGHQGHMSSQVVIEVKRLTRRIDDSHGSHFRLRFEQLS